MSTFDKAVALASTADSKAEDLVTALVDDSTGTTAVQRVTKASAEKERILAPDRLPSSTENFLALNPLASQEQLGEYTLLKVHQDLRDENEARIEKENNTAAQSRNIGQIVGDTAVDIVGKGIAVTAPEMIFGASELLKKAPLIKQTNTARRMLTGLFSGESGAEVAEREEEQISQIAPVFNEAREILTAIQSDELQATKKVMDRKSAERAAIREEELGENPELFDIIKSEAGAAVDTAVAYAQNPSALASTVSESLPQMLVPGGITKGITKGVLTKAGKASVAPNFNKTKKGRDIFNALLPKDKVGKNFRRTPQGKQLLDNIRSHAERKGAAEFAASKAGKAQLNRIAETAGVTYTALSEGLSNAVGIKGEIMSASESQLRKSSDPYNELREAGKTHEQARRALADEAFTETFVIAGALGGASSYLSGAGKLEGKLFKSDSAFGSNILTKIVGSGTKEAIEETAQGASGQFAGNVAKSNTSNTDQNLLEGTGDAAGAGFVTGLASGGGLAGIANAPKALATGARTAGNQVVKLSDKKTGMTEEVRTAVKTGNTADITDTKNEDYDAENAINTEFLTVPEDDAGAAKQFDKIKTHLLKMNDEINSMEPGKAQDDKQKRFEAHISKLRGLNQERQKKAQATTKEFVENLPDKADAEVSEKIDTSLNTFGSSPRSSQEAVDNTIQQAEAIINSGLANPEQTKKLEEQVTTLKTYDVVTQEVFNGREQFSGINFYQENIQGAIDSNDTETAQTGLDALTKFTKTHANKLAQLEIAFPAWDKKDRGQDITVEEQAAIDFIESKPLLKGNGNFKISSNTKLGILPALRKEVAALEAATIESQSIIQAGPSAVEASTASQVVESANERSEVGEPKTSNASVETKEVSRGQSLLNEATELGLKIPAAIRNNPEHKKSIKSLTAKVKAAKKATPSVAPNPGGSESTNGPQDDSANNGSVNKKNSPQIKDESKTKESKASKKMRQDSATQLLSPLRNDKNVNQVNDAIFNLAEKLKEFVGNKGLGPALKSIRKGIKNSIDGKIDLTNKDKNYLLGLQLAKDTELKDEFSLKDNILENSASPTDRINKDGKIVNKGADNILSTLFKAVKTNVNNRLQTISNLFTKMETDINVIGELTDKQREAMPVIQKFNKIFTDTFFNKVLRVKDPQFAFQDTFQYFISAGATQENLREHLNENLVSTMGMVALNWVATRSGDTVVNNKDAVNRLLGRDTKQAVTPTERIFLSQAGTLQKNVVSSIGKDVIKALGIKVNSDAPGQTVSNLENAIGNMVLATLLSSDMVTQTTIPSIVFNSFKDKDFASPSMDMLNNIKTYKITAKDKTDSAINSALSNTTKGKQINRMDIAEVKFTNQKGKAFYSWTGKEWKKHEDTTTNFIRVVTEVNEDNIAIPASNIQDYMEAIQDSDKVLEVLFGVDSYATEPSLEAPTEAPKLLKNSFLKVPDKMRKVLEKIQKRSHKLHQNMFDVMDWLDLHDEKNSLIIQGVDYDYETTAHSEDRKSIEAKNADILRNHNHIQAFRKRVGNSAFYFKSVVWKNMRMGLDSNTVNPQTDKHHRFMLGMESHTVTLDPNNRKHMQQFFSAVGQGLKIDVDKNTITGSLNALHEKFEKNDILKDGIDALINRNNPDAVIAAVKMGGENTHSLAALVAYAEYIKADGKPFTTNLTREVDGITNGVAIGLLQLMRNQLENKLKRTLKRTGIFTDSTTGFGGWINKTTNNDSYQNMSLLWVNSLRAFSKAPPSDFVNMTNNTNAAMTGLASLVGKMIDETGITSVGRKLVKNPLMITNYGAGIKKVIGAFTENRIANIYTEIAEANQKENPNAEITIIINNINATLGNGIKPIDIGTVLSDPLEWTMPFNIKLHLESLIQISYGSTLEAAIDNEFGEFIEERKQLVKATSLMFEGFKLRYETGYNRLVAKNNGDMPSREAVDALNESLLDSMPMFKGFFSGTNDDGILVMNSVNAPADVNNTKFLTDTRVTSPMDTTHIGVNGVATPGAPVKSLKAHATKPTWEDGGVSGPISAIHNLDSATMLNMLENNEAINVHDAAIFSLLDVEESSQDFNKQFIETMQNYSMAAEINTALERTMRLLSTIDKKTNNTGQRTNYISKLNKSQGRKLSSDDKPITVGQFMRQFKQQADINDQKRDEFFPQITGVDQYTAGELSTFLLDKDLPNDQRKVIEDVITELQGELKQQLKDKENDDKAPDQQSIELTGTNTRLVLQHLKALDVNESFDEVDIAKVELRRLIKLIEQGDSLDSAIKKVTDILAARQTSALKKKLNREITEDDLTVDSFPIELREALVKSLKEDSTSFQKDLLFSDSFGSDLNDIDPNTFIADNVQEITNKDTEAVYDSLGKDDPVGDSQEHDSHLRLVLSSIINKVLKPTNLFTRELGDTNEGLFSNGDIYMSNSQPSKMSALGARMSQREVFVHELIHNVSHSAVNGSTAIARQLRKLYTEVRDSGQIDATSFMEGNYQIGDPGYAAELKVAQLRYDYIFGDKIGTHVIERKDPLTGQTIREVLDNSHHEFLAIGVTNAAFRKALKNVKTKRKTFKDGDTLIESFTNLLENMLNYFAETFAGTRGKSIDRQLMLLAGQLAGVDTRAKNKLWQSAEKAGDIVGKSFDTLAFLVTKPFNILIGSSIVKKSRFRAVKGLGTIAESIPYLDEYPAAIRYIRNSMGITGESLSSSFLTELQGLTKDNGYLHALGRLSNKIIDQLRKRITVHVSKMVRDSFKTELSKEEMDAMSKVFLKADIDGLFLADAEGNVNYDGTELHKLLTSKTALHKEIDSIVKTLKTTFTKNGLYYSSMGLSLGHEMATGRPIEKWSLKNANVIAELDATNLKAEGDLKLAEELIDRLATLSAINHTDSKHVENAAAVVQREFAENKDENGILFTMALHRESKRKALELSFKGQKKLFVKGYTKEIFNPNKSFTIAPASHEVELNRQGFTMGEKVKKDGVDPQTGAELYMYINNDGAPSTFMAGILSFTNQRAKGANVVDVYSQQGELDPVASAYLDRPIIDAAKRRQIAAIANGISQPLPDDEGVLIPILDGKGNVSDYRYQMDEHKKDTILDKNNQLDAILGGMEANIEDKKNTEIINNEVISATKSFYDKNKKKNNIGFTEIGPKAPLEKYRQIYHMLPKSTRDEMRRVWGNDTMFIRSEEAVLVFGQRKFSIAQLEKRDAYSLKGREYIDAQVNNVMSFLLNHKVGRFSESVWQESIKLVKDAIVIKSGGVLIGNVISNTILLKTLGVPVKNIAIDQARALVFAKEFLRDTELLATLRDEEKLVPTKKGKNLKRIRELETAINRNPVKELFDAGIHQSIIEDVEDNDNPHSYQGKLESFLKKNKVTGTLINHTPELLKTGLKNVFMTHDTAIYKFMRDATQLSDFASRFALHEHNKKQGMDPKKSIDAIVEAFINYDLPTHQYLQYGNDMGLTMFTKFFIRIQKVIFMLAKERPGSLLATMVAQGLTIDMPEISDSTFTLNRILNKVGNPIDLPEEIIDAPYTIGSTLID